MTPVKYIFSRMNSILYTDFIFQIFTMLTNSDPRSLNEPMTRHDGLKSRGEMKNRHDLTSRRDSLGTGTRAVLIKKVRRSVVLCRLHEFSSWFINILLMDILVTLLLFLVLLFASTMY